MLFELKSLIHPDPHLEYIQHTFNVPEGVTGLRLEFDYKNEDTNTLYISIYDPLGFRGNKMKPGKKGDVHLELWMDGNHSSPGALPGKITAGKWRVQVDIASVKTDQTYCIKIFGLEGNEPEEYFRLDTQDNVIETGDRYYKGELHCHSDESDGKYPVADVVREAQRLGFDFLAMTDHITISHWARLQEMRDVPMALLHSCEITSRHGHANMHNIQKWVNVYTDGDNWDMNKAADEVHRQGGLFCINHAFSGGRLGFRSFYFDWKKADLMEIYHNLEGCNNQPMISFWDHQMLQGYRLIGVGGTDSHDPYTGTHKLGNCLTYIFTDELSEVGIIRGLKKGNVFVSKGAQIRFSAKDERGNVYHMGDCASGKGKLTLSISALCDEALRAFIIRDGLIMDYFNLENQPGEWYKIQMAVPIEGASFYRVELHAMDVESHDPKYPGILWRDHESMRAYSNPIFIKQG